MHATKNINFANSCVGWFLRLHCLHKIQRNDPRHWDNTLGNWRVPFHWGRKAINFPSRQTELEWPDNDRRNNKRERETDSQATWSHPNSWEPNTKDRNNYIKTGDHERHKFWTPSFINISSALSFNGWIAGNLEAKSVLLIFRKLFVTNKRWCRVRVIK
jgi:hypothetical protein